MGNGTEGLQNLSEKFERENELVAIPTQVWWLVNIQAIRVRRQNQEIAASSVVFVVTVSKVANGLYRRGIKAVGVWYPVEACPKVPPDRGCELSGGWGQIESMCGSKPTSGNCPGHHRTSNHKCNLVGCSMKQGALCGHTLEKCPNCKGNHIAFSNRCAEKTEATEAMQYSG